ncbi:MAG TPA: tripartite tricarboxylate transporter TctB family protein [Microvirga sp.]|jgi:putative tricarboxylic transport membrane protein
MKVSDLGAGIFFLVVSIVLAGAAWTLPNPAAQPLGPGAFPLLLAALMAVSALVLAARGVVLPNRTTFITLAPWVSNTGLIARFLLVPLTVVAYVAFVEPVGFLLTATSILLVLLLAGLVSFTRALPLAAAAALSIHTIFQFGLGVQLPWGLLEPIRW